MSASELQPEIGVRQIEPLGDLVRNRDAPQPGRLRGRDTVR